MLEYIRNHVAGVIGSLIILILAFVFAVSFGQQSEGWGKGTGDDTVIRVDGTKISETLLTYTMNMMTNLSNTSPDSSEYQSVRQQAAAALIERQLLLDLAEETGITASTEEAQTNIINGVFHVTRSITPLVEQLNFRMQYGALAPEQVASILVSEGHQAMLGKFENESGAFDTKMFDNTVRYRFGMSASAFVEQQRLELMAKRVRALLLTGVEATPKEVRRQYNMDNDTVTLSYIKLTPDDFESQLDMSEEAIKDWATQNPDPISQYYETNKYKYTNVEKSVHARHILIKVAKDADEETRTQARQQIVSLRDRLNAGEDFAQLAKEHSEDEGSAPKGGDLGYTPKGVMVPEFDDVMFSLEKNQISQIVTTPFGFHIIQALGTREGDVSLEEATAEIAQRIYKKQQGTQLARKTATSILHRLKTGTDIDDVLSLDPSEADTSAAASETPPQASPTAPDTSVADTTLSAQLQALDVDVDTTAAFNRFRDTVPGIGKSKDLVQTAFTLTSDRPLAEDIFEIDDSFVVIQLAERATPSDDEFENKRDIVHSRIMAQKMTTWLNDRINSMLLGAMKAGKVESAVAFENAS